MRILFVNDFVPDSLAGHGGGRIMYHYAREMQARGHAVAHVCVVRPIEHAALARLRAEGQAAYPAWASRSPLRRLRRLLLSLGLPIEYAFCRSVGLAAAVGQAVAEFQPAVVHATQPHCLEAVFDALAHGPATSRPPAVVAHAIDVVSKLRLRQAVIGGWSARRALALAAPRELRLYRRAGAVVCHSASDRAFLRAFLPAELPIAVLPVWFEGWGAARGLAQPAREGPFEYDALYVGNSRDPRTVEALDWFFGQVHPALVNQLGAHPAIALAGVYPDAPIPHCVSPDVTCLDYVSDVLPLYNKSAMFIAPLQSGGGIHVKILNAFARGCPVVMTSAANDGIGAEDGAQALIADDPADFAERMARLLAEPGLSRCLAEAGWRWVADYVKDGFQPLEDLYYSLAERCSHASRQWGD
jgi:glycosyltransferase involved in cell wall biosynthesis